MLPVEKDRRALLRAADRERARDAGVDADRAHLLEAEGELALRGATLKQLLGALRNPRVLAALAAGAPVLISLWEGLQHMKAGLP